MVGAVDLPRHSPCILTKPVILPVDILRGLRYHDAFNQSSQTTAKADSRPFHRFGRLLVAAARGTSFLGCKPLPLRAPDGGDRGEAIARKWDQNIRT
jgi:hypothetical protein